ncbi:LuxR C-terminal-related transcriptional regulator [Micromonospora sp. RHAY321]|uniref:helix-turn-helix transcriptional regulator n=1 Tax=Micromonospora sp. RHAY321 TaxID=2944807 RepID=UPI00207D272A|nr:LuxR C-terminal-related transcriptional regulator [Micromonospora sp. RHAY321]MCO1596957.1 LuxR C-terminal-related transcriptional regulator [Micromonospora sp. RHAY321]
MIMNDVAESRLVLGKGPKALLDTVSEDPTGPLTVGLVGPGGHGKSALLAELARVHQHAGIPVRTGAPEPGDPVAPDALLLVDDAHLLDDARLGELLRLVSTRRHRVVVAHRPWPRSAALMELADTLRRDGQAVLLTPFTREQTAAYLDAAPELGRRSDLVDFVQAQTGGVPRDVERLARGLRVPHGSPVEPPRSVVLEFGPDLEVLPSDVRRLMLAVAAGVPLPVSMLGALLGREPEAVDELIALTRAAGLLGADGRLAPIVRRAVTTLSPANDRAAVWRRLTELQLARGGAVLPLVRSLLAAGVLGDCPAPTLAAAAEEALAEEPAFAAELFAAATAAGLPASARQALAAALAGNLDDALRVADRLLMTAAPIDRTEAAMVAATALAHRGHVGRSVELYRWSGTASSVAFATVGGLASGDLTAAAEPAAGEPAGEPPTLHASAARLMADGVRESVTGPPTAALSALVQAAALLEPAGRAALLPDSPAALAALTAVHCGELEIAERVLHRALVAGVGGPLMARRHRLLQAWILMVRGQTHAAAEHLAAVTVDGRPLESRDLLFAAALRMGIGRRNSDLGALKRGWGQALEAVVRHPVDLFTLLPLGELAIAGARLGDLARLDPYLREGRSLLGRLGEPALWSVPLHWSGLHAAILTDEPSVADEHVAALLAAAGHSRYAAVVAAAAESWVEVLRGVVDPVRVEAAARGLHDTGLCWDGARLAGQAAIRTSDRRAMTTLLECARVLQGRPAGANGGQRPPAGEGAPQVADAIAGPAQQGLSDREYEVAELVLAGLTYREIGDRLFISAKTVEHHVARMRNRLNCANRAELLALLRTVVADRASNAAGQPWPRRSAR